MRLKKSARYCASCSCVLRTAAGWGSCSGGLLLLLSPFSAAAVEAVELWRRGGPFRSEDRRRVGTTVAMGWTSCLCWRRSILN